MTQYLSKLARRLATLYAVVGAAACSEAAPRDFLGPDPNTPPPSGGPVSLHIAPKSGAIAANQPLQFRAWGRTATGDSIAVAVSWSASGGQIGPEGVFRSAVGGSFSVQAFAVGRPHLTDGAIVSVEAPASIFSAVHVLPGNASVPMGGTLQFHASALLLSGGSTVPSVTWSATGGTISATGLYSAGMAPGLFRVVATTIDGAHRDTVQVAVAAASLQSLAVSPKALTMSAGEQVDFAVSGQWSDGTSAPPAVTWTAQGGAVSPLGRFTAGTSPGVYPVVARHVPSARTDTALVTIMPAVVRIEVTPASYQLQPGATRAFEARAVRTDGVVLPVAVSWSATGGTISPAGVYLAGGTPGSFRVIARYLGGAFADTATVTIALPAATLTGLAITPKSAAVGSGAQVHFTAVPTWSDGSSAQPALVWSAIGGQVSGGGIWTAPLAAGSYQVVVRHPASGLADTASVTVTEAPRVTAVTILGQGHTLQTGGTKQFSAQATWSDGVNRPVEWLWSATGGTISVNGLYSAGSVAGQFLVIASCLGCTASDTSGVTVTSSPPPAATLLSLALNPPNALLHPGDVLPLHLSASWSDGSTQVPDIAWTVQGGTRSGLNYTAGSAEGTYLVIARHAAGTLADTTVVTIVAPGSPPPNEPVLTSLVLNPSSVTMNPGETRPLTVAATWSDGTTTVPPLAWDVTGGTLAGLVYTAGATPGSYRIIVRHQGGTKADTTAVTIAAAASTLQSLTITPNPASVQAGNSVAFSVTGSMSDGSTTTPAVAWTATGGTISSSGVYTASTATGAFQVTATHAASGLSTQAAVTVTAPGDWVVNEPELPRYQVDIAYPVITGKTIHVAQGGNLQAAINGANCGDEIVLAAGATFTGRFILPDKGCTSYIVIRGGAPIPPAGTRVTPQTAASFPRLVAPGGNASPIEVNSGAGYYRLVGLEVTTTVAAGNLNALVRLHNGGAQALADLPHHIILDRMYIHGHPSMGLGRCVLMNSAWTAVVDSYLDDCHTKGSDSQAIVGYGGPGPFLILNNYLAGAGENVMFGGAPPSVLGVIPSDIVIRGNHFTKPVEWIGTWTVKNLFELKNAQRVLVEGNLFENNWTDGQVGYAILLKATATGGNAPWTTVRDVTFRQNLIRNSPFGLNIAADPGTNEAIPASLMLIQDNIFENIGSFNGTTGTYWAGILGSKSGLRDIQLVHNTVVSNVTTSLMQFDGSTESERFIVRDNVFFLGRYGIKGSGTAEGTPSLNHYFRSYSVASNVFVTDRSNVASRYPDGNTFLASGAAYSAILGSDGRPVGADKAIVDAHVGRALIGVR